ncbi:hypothetical protein [Candidatus Rariloculus sp.]|uniref:hypothetical protein n=1 Tax=Candidatus Rariloculus sp. TaxID=3101265 RepID=UPI003D0D9D1E
MTDKPDGNSKQKLLKRIEALEAEVQANAQMTQYSVVAICASLINLKGDYEVIAPISEALDRLAEVPHQTPLSKAVSDRIVNRVRRLASLVRELDPAGRRSASES